jgi:Fe-S cluster assembly protein SufD
MTAITDDIFLDRATPEALSRRLAEPEWLAARRRKAFQAVQSLPFPRPTDEAWRRTDPERFLYAGHRLAGHSPLVELLGDSPADVHSMSLARALAERGPEVERLLGGLAPLEHLFVALNQAFFSGGSFTAVEPGAVLPHPARVTHRFAPAEGEKTAVMPRSLVHMGAGSEGTLVEVYESAPGDLLAAPVAEIYVEPEARLQYVVVYRWGQGARVVSHFHARVARDARLRLLFLGLGGSVVKNWWVGDLVGQGAGSECLGLVLGEGRQHFDCDVMHNHLVPHTSSDVLFNVALTGRARSVFMGNIMVARGAQKTDAYQKNRNLLLSQKARADSIPRLEIGANDVRCTHGATFSTYDRDQEFYLQTRGLSAAQARSMIVHGFFQEVIERLSGQELVEWLTGLMEQKMDSALADLRESR